MTTYDYKNQAWVVDGRYVSCFHHESMDCQCYGKLHDGELVDFMEVQIKAYDDDRQYFIVMRDGNFLCKQGFHSIQAAKDWMEKHYPLTQFYIHE